MKISIDDLEKALKWIKTNSSDVYVVLYIGEGKFKLNVKDKYDSFVEITVFENSTMMAKIKKEDFLR